MCSLTLSRGCQYSFWNGFATDNYGKLYLMDLAPFKISTFKCTFKKMPSNDFQHGLALFNRGHFFDAHEALEDVWRSIPPATLLRRQVQGLVQLAVAFHHESTGNRVGARSVLDRALRNLEGADRSFPDLDFDRLRTDLKHWQKHLGGIGSTARASADRHAQSHAVSPCREKDSGRSARSLANATLLKSRSVKSIAMQPPRTSPESVPLLDLRRQYDGIREEVLAAIEQVCDSQSFILGPEVEALETRDCRRSRERPPRSVARPAPRRSGWRSSLPG